MRELLIAEMKGKIPTKLQNSEDLLTSSVIGTFRYLSSSTYIQSVLESSMNIKGRRLLFDTPIKKCLFEFWPRLDDSEPDVLLRLIDANDHEYLLCIEAKFWSDKSSEEDTTIDVEERKNWQRDQLAREIETIHTVDCHKFMKVNQEKLKRIMFVYLTNDTYLHFKEIKESISFVKDIDFSIDHIYWLSWKQIFNVINSVSHFQTPQDAMLLTDLGRLLRKKGLVSFNGFHNMQHVYPYVNRYQYENAHKHYLWSEMKAVDKTIWSYGGKYNG
ncbi:hypothetical protein [Bacillus dakarensis]|uniref:hypothetical protein n=1 Tax=Robertmurraya dakarensis TaxID=1926278 RepID=UPI00111553E0|nr:hypothetical protein [Bacillus dakarensis]